MRRREFINVLGSVAAWPLAARAQQPTMPVIGFLNSQSPEGYAEPLRGLRQGLKESGYVEGENLAIEYRWADNQMERLPELAAELVGRRVALIITTGGPSSALSAKAATTAIPIVFNIGDDPVKVGLVASFARPGGNLTGVSFLGIELIAKRLELLRELVPGTARVGVLVNPADANIAQATLRDTEAACRTMGLQFQVFNADNSREMETAFENMARERPDVLFVASSPFFVVRRIQVVQRAAFHRIPAGYPLRDFADAGGLMSYGASLRDAYRQVGIYAGRILKGATPQDLPVVQSTKFELVINHPTARMLGLTVPPMLLARADEVIE
jgi:putative tryptophan/tyrosine transport system substrate-binding protein